MITKKCTKCGIEYPATSENFSNKKGCKYGLNCVCRNCERIIQRNYRKNNFEKISDGKKRCYNEKKDEYLSRQKEYNKINEIQIKKKRAEYRANNKDKIYQRHKEYVEKNRESLCQKRRLKRKENPDLARSKERDYYNTNKQRILELSKKYIEKKKECYKKWLKNNADKNREYEQLRRSRKRKVKHSLTMEQWKAIKDYFNDSCAYCGITDSESKEKYGRTLCQDHIIPVVSGGSYSAENIIPACLSCNSRKRTQELFAWFKSSEHYTLERETKIRELQARVMESQIAREWGRKE